MTKLSTGTTPRDPAIERPVVAVPPGGDASPRDAMGLTEAERANLSEEDKAAIAAFPVNFARASTNSVSGAQRVIQAAEANAPGGATADWRAAIEELVAASGQLRGNDLSKVEDMHLHQSVALQSLFVRLTERALSPGVSTQHFDLFMRYALRAQSQCRATLEALAEVKNPPVVIARQANITTGNQQINNGDSPRTRGRENRSEQIEVSGEGHELPANARTSSLASPSDTPMAPVGVVDGAEDNRRQVTVLPQRLEGRRARHASGSAASAGSAKG